ncbi:MAG: helix-turn-helix domain-containing protein [Lachnospiraceae bacterium]
MNMTTIETLIPKQPFMVKLSSYYYKYIVGNYGISHFYSFRPQDDIDEIGTSVPDGCIDIIFQYDRFHNEVVADFYGTALLPHSMKILPGSDCFGVRFLPGNVPLLADAMMPDLIDKIIPYEKLGRIKDLPEIIFRQDDFKDRIKIFMKEYMKLYELQYMGCIPLKDSLISEIIKERGNISVLNLSETTCYSVSYIDKIFLKEIGISPKKFSGIIRFQWMMNKIIVDPNDRTVNYASFMSELGYYDQSHMIREFKKYSGRTPNMYLNELFRDDYLNRLKVVV